MARKIPLYAQRPMVEVIDNMEQADASAVFKPVMLEVHRPDSAAGTASGSGFSRTSPFLDFMLSLSSNSQ